MFNGLVLKQRYDFFNNASIFVFLVSHTSVQEVYLEMNRGGFFLFLTEKTQTLVY